MGTPAVTVHTTISRPLATIAAVAKRADGARGVWQHAAQLAPGLAHGLWGDSNEARITREIFSMASAAVNAADTQRANAVLGAYRDYRFGQGIIFRSLKDTHMPVAEARHLDTLVYQGVLLGAPEAAALCTIQALPTLTVPMRAAIGATAYRHFVESQDPAAWWMLSGADGLFSPPALSHEHRQVIAQIGLDHSRLAPQIGRYIRHNDLANDLGTGWTETPWTKYAGDAAHTPAALKTLCRYAALGVLDTHIAKMQFTTLGALDPARNTDTFMMAMLCYAALEDCAPDTVGFVLSRSPEDQAPQALVGPLGTTAAPQSLDFYRNLRTWADAHVYSGDFIRATGIHAHAAAESVFVAALTGGAAGPQGLALVQTAVQERGLP